jgi:LuxR family maltose regulon positive regulatory protein
VPIQADELHHMIDTIRLGPLGASSLTAAELRLLPLLATHLSYGEIGDRLIVSRNTVKTHAVSIFRKLGVSSRSEAIEVAEAVGLLGH